MAKSIFTSEQKSRHRELRLQGLTLKQISARLKITMSESKNIHRSNGRVHKWGQRTIDTVADGLNAGLSCEKIAENCDLDVSTVLKYRYILQAKDRP